MFSDKTEKRGAPAGSIITQTAIELVAVIVRTIEENGLSTIGRTAETLFGNIVEGTLNILSSAVSEMDNAVLAAKEERKLDGLTVKERNVPRTFTTKPGDLHYSRTYFSQKDGGNLYLFHLIGVKSNKRMSKELCAMLVQLASEMSMQKAARSSRANSCSQKHIQQYTENQANEAFGECHDLSIFENVRHGSIMSYKLAARILILNSYAKCGRSISSLDFSQKLLTRSIRIFVLTQNVRYNIIYLSYAYRSFAHDRAIRFEHTLGRRHLRLVFVYYDYNTDLGGFMASNSDFSLLYKTRNGASPRNKAKVYFSYHPDDFSYFEHISEIILAKQNCAIYYYCYTSGTPDNTELSNLLREMQLFVIPVTSNFLFLDCNAFSSELRFAQDNGIPILPLLQNSDLASAFNEKCNNLQFLDEYSKDSSAISFDEKITAYLSAVLADSETVRRIQDAFDAHVFLSYRKIDRELAQELMQMIHRNPECRDIAIWYDEFLVAGEPFDISIQKALADCDVFALLVTPNILLKNANGEDNYVMSSEYPAASEASKNIVPVEAAETDKDELKSKFKGIPECISTKDEHRITSALLTIINGIRTDARVRRLAQAENSSMEHSFLVGLAYLMGIEVERNPEHAFELIKKAADAGLPEALRKLSEMYYYGTGTKRDLRKAAELRRKDYQYHKEQYIKTRTDDELREYLIQLEVYAYMCSALNDPAETQKAYSECISLLEKLVKQDPFNYGVSLASAYNNSALRHSEQGDVKTAEKYYNKAISWLKSLARVDPDRAEPYLATAYNDAGSFFSNHGDRALAVEYYKNAIRLRERLAVRDPESHETALSHVYNNIAILYMEQDEVEKAEEYYAKLVALLERIFAYDPSVSNLLALAYSNLGLNLTYQREFLQAEALLKKSFELCKGLVAKNLELYSIDYAKACTNLSLLYFSILDIDQAKEYAMLAIHCLSPLASVNPIRYDSQLICAYNNLARCYITQYNSSEAAKHLATARAIAEKYASVGLEDYDFPRLLVLLNAAEYCICVDEEQAALEHLQTAIPLSEKLMSINPAKYTINFVACLLVTAKFYILIDEPQNAQRLIEKCLAASEDALKRNPRKYILLLPEVYRLAGVTYCDLNDLRKAKAFFKKGISVCNELQAENTGNYDNLLVVFYITAIEFYEHIDMEAQSDECCREALPLLERLVLKGFNDHKNSLAYVYVVLGTHDFNAEEFESAASHLMKSAAICSELIEQGIEPTEQYNRMSKCYYLLGAINYYSGDDDKCEMYYSKSIDILAFLCEESPEEYAEILNEIRAEFEGIEAELGRNW